MNKILFIFFTIMFILNLIITIRPYILIKQDEEEFKELIQLKEEITQNKKEIQTISTKERYEELSKINNDMIGWIKIEGTNIDYPVMYSKNNEDYYLSHSFYKEKSYSGTPFVSKNYNIDNNNILIYGHNVNNKTLFSELLNYANYDFYQKHKYIQFDSLTEEKTYEIISVFKSKVYYEDETVFKYYKMDYNLNEQEFNYYIENIKKISLYNIEESATYNENLITLSTCNNEMEDGRFVVVAKKTSKKIA